MSWQELIMAQKIVQLKKNNRYYIVESVTDLFGSFVIILRWGSLKINWERKKEIPARDLEHAEKLFENAVRKKIIRGYRRLKS